MVDHRRMRLQSLLRIRLRVVFLVKCVVQFPRCFRPVLPRRQGSYSVGIGWFQTTVGVVPWGWWEDSGEVGRASAIRPQLGPSLPGSNVAIVGVAWWHVQPVREKYRVQRLQPLFPGLFVEWFRRPPYGRSLVEGAEMNSGVARWSISGHSLQQI